MHTELASQVRISASHVGSLYQQVSLPLRACHARQHQEQGGVIIALDGLAPQGCHSGLLCVWPSPRHCISVMDVTCLVIGLHTLRAADVRRSNCCQTTSGKRVRA